MLYCSVGSQSACALCDLQESEGKAAAAALALRQLAAAITIQAAWRGFKVCFPIHDRPGPPAPHINWASMLLVWDSQLSLSMYVV